MPDTTPATDEQLETVKRSIRFSELQGSSVAVFVSQMDARAILARLDAAERMVEEYERLFQIGFEPWRVKYAKPASFATGDSPGFWYVVASNRRGPGYASAYLQRDGTKRMDCSNGHFDTEEQARAALAAVSKGEK